MAEIREIPLADMGDAEAATVVEIFVAPGDRVAAEDPILSLESDKAAIEFPAPAAGKIVEIKVAVDDEVEDGTILFTLEVDAEAAGDAPASGGESEPEAEPATSETAVEAETEPEAESSETEPEAESSETEPESRPEETQEASPKPAAGPIDQEAFDAAYASPAVRRLARELEIDLGRVRGSGRNGRITKDDLHGFIKSAMAGGTGAGGGVGGFDWPQMPEIDFAKFGEVEVQPLSRIRKVSARNLHRSWLHVPHVTQHELADITEMEAFRKAHGEEAKRQGYKLTPVAFLLKACASALRTYPEFGSSLDPSGENLILKKYVHIGIAVDTPNGLVVPVIRDVDQKSLSQLGRELGEVSTRARDGKLAPKEFQGGTFTISSLGGIGGTAFTPIVNAPEVAILGVSRSRMEPVWQDGEFVPRLMLPLSLSYDHRVIDGAAAARFVVHLARLLGDIRRLLL